MTRAQQPSILSFFQKQQPPRYAAPPAQPSKTPPQAPPLPPAPRQHQQPPTISNNTHAVNPDFLVAPNTILSPHPSASIVPIVEAHIPALRRINTLLLPVNYQESFYNGILDPAVSGTFSRAILWQDSPTDAPKVIGGVVCRLERSPFDDNSGRYSRDLAKKAQSSAAPPPLDQGYALYIQSLGLLSPYRRYGLVAAAVQGILDAAVQLTSMRAGRGEMRIDWVYAHVWTENEEGLAWYAGRDFQKDCVLEDYYFKLKPGSAWVVKKRLTASPATLKGNERIVSSVALVSDPAGVVTTSVTAAVVNMPPISTSTNSPPAASTAPAPINGPPKSSAARPPPPESSLSFQNKRPDMEWNDLPEDMMSSSKNSSRSNLLAPPMGGSTSSSRSSSTQRKKKDRAYPTAAFGS